MDNFYYNGDGLAAIQRLESRWQREASDKSLPVSPAAHSRRQLEEPPQRDRLFGGLSDMLRSEVLSW